MDTTKDYYAILGVLPTAEDIVIRAAYKALAQRYHPDRWKGAPQEANDRMAELNEAYSVLSDSNKRDEYDKARGSTTPNGETYFRDEQEDAPPSYDPLEDDWKIAIQYYPDLTNLEGRLANISWRLAYSFRAYLLQGKMFEKRKEIGELMEEEFLKSYFGSNPKIVAFARFLIDIRFKNAARTLNTAVRVLGNNLDADLVIKKIKQEYFSSPTAREDLMKCFSIRFDGSKYILPTGFGDYRYSEMEDAIQYAIKTQMRGF